MLRALRRAVGPGAGDASAILIRGLIVSLMSYATSKGARQAERIIDAAYRCLATYGYSGISMQRIADIAGVNKRLLHYYFETREQLIDEVARRVGDRILAQVEEAIGGLEDPTEMVEVGFGRLWGSVRSDPELQSVFFGLAAESVTNASLKRTLVDVNDAYRSSIHRVVRRLSRRGYRLRMDEGSMTTLIIAAFQGLTLQFLEQGQTPTLDRAISDFKGWLATIALPPGSDDDAQCRGSGPPAPRLASSWNHDDDR
ncbi:MAG: TetR/AcrR family transcriptional regulator [Solirubrobacterales bacterium]